MSEIRENKLNIRKQFRAARAAVPADKKAELDAAICARFLSLAVFRYAGTVLLFAPIKDEIDVMPIAEEALRAGKAVGFPRIEPETRAMTFHRIFAIPELKPDPDHYGIREPAPDAPLIDTCASGVVCVVPALVYDAEGYRIGYGGGYYDRFLNSFPGAKIGPVYADFIVDSIPRGRFDARVDTLITEKGVITLNV